MSDKLKAVGRFLCAEFNSVAKVYFAPLVGLCKGAPISHTSAAWELRDQEQDANFAALKRDFK